MNYLRPRDWRRGRLAAIRQEHIFVRVLFWTAAALFACCLIAFSFMLLGDAHPLAGDYTMYITAFQTPYCHTWESGLLWEFVLKYPRYAFLGRHSGPVYIPPFMLFYLLFVYALMKRTGYDGLGARKLTGVFLIFSAVSLSCWISAEFAVIYLYQNDIPVIFPLTYSFSPDFFSALRLGGGEGIYPQPRSDCASDLTALMLGAGHCLVIAIICAIIVRLFYAKDALVYKCVYHSLAMGWFVYPAFAAAVIAAADGYVFYAGKNLFGEILGLVSPPAE